MNERKPILCLDFDGVIHSYSSGWKGADVIPDPPVEGAFNFMYEAISYFDVQIYSSRSGQAGGLQWREVPNDERVVGKALGEVLPALRSEKLPSSSEDCEWCPYVRMRMSI